MQPDDVGKIVTDYGSVLVAPSLLGLLRDINSLPHLKTEIKAALKLGLSVTTDAEFRDQLKLAYISLADFQKLTEQEVRAFWRPDHWCHIGGDGVPNGDGWVWCGEGFELR